MYTTISSIVFLIVFFYNKYSYKTEDADNKIKMKRQVNELWK